MAPADALGNLVRFEPLPGQRCDAVNGAPLIRDLEFGGPIADKAFGAARIVEELDARGARIVISQRPQRTDPRPIDAELRKRRRLIENLPGRFKAFKRVALRARKTDASFAAMICAAAILNSKRTSTGP